MKWEGDFFFAGYPASFLFYEVVTWGIILGIPVLGFFLFRSDLSFWVKILLTLGLIASEAVMIWGSFIEPRQLVVRDFKLSDTKLPSMKVVVVSDIHVGPHKKADFLKKIVEKVNAQSPDLILIPGDFVYGIASKFVAELEPLRDLKAPVFATLGNHDHFRDPDRNKVQSEAVSAALADLGIRELRNASASFSPKNVWIVGVDDNYLGYDDLEKAFAGVPSGAPVILLAHSPDIMDTLQQEGIRPDLVVSGHTHAGQIRLPWLGAVPFTIPTDSGKALERDFYEKNGVRIFISGGVGEVGPRARLLNPPEIDVVRI